MEFTVTTIIDRPARAVWEIVGRRFGDAAVWASSIEASRAVGEPTLPGAPSDSRECQVAVAGTDRLVERLVAYDEDAMTLTYALADGMQHVARSAANTWRVAAVDAGRAELTISAEVALAPVGRLLSPFLRAYLSVMGRRNADDLKQYVETGHPSARKLRQATGLARLDAWATGNAAFTAVCGVALTLLPQWWAEQLGGVPAWVPGGIGAGLLLYATGVAWLAGRGLTQPLGRGLALLDGGWVVGMSGVVAISGTLLTGTGVAVIAASTAVIAGFGSAQWRAASPRATGGFRFVP